MMGLGADHHKFQPTRGYGLLETMLAKFRSRKANALIPGHLREGRLLDIGCGGYPYFLLNTIFKEKYGLDQDPAVIRYGEAVPGGESLILRQWDFGDEKELPFAAGFFDVVTMLAVFEHIEIIRLRPLVAEIYRVLKEGGVFILTTPSPWTDLLLRLLARLKLVSAVEIFDHKDTYSHGKTRQVLEDCGFDKKNITLGYFILFMNTWGKVSK